MVLKVTPVGYYPNSEAAPLGGLLSVLSAPSQPVFAFWSPVAGNKRTWNGAIFEVHACRP